MKSLPKLIASIVGCELVGLLGTPFTVSAIPAWYSTLTKPFFAPPNWIFGPIWTLLYLLMGISLYLIWRRNLHNRSSQIAYKYFFIQLGLNFLWSPVFFGLRSPLFGLLIIITMWVFIIMTMRQFYSLSRPASHLLAPYLAWVSFATLLNAAILILN